MFLLLFAISCFLHTVYAGSVALCKDQTTCESCSESYIYVLGFRENCRWCVNSKTCGGPFSCSIGSGVVQREAFMCPKIVPAEKGRRYTDRLGRSLYSLVLAVREQDPEECLANSRPDIRMIKRYEVECDQSRNHCAGMIAVSEAAKSIYIVYKSSNMDRQLLTEFIHSIAAQLGAWEKFEVGGGIMTYFHGAFERLFKNTDMRKDLAKLKEKYPQFKVWVTGHSLGASLASITALYLANHTMFPAERIRLVTFGEPRTGNVGFARAIEKSLPFTYRIVHKNDLVTNIPTSFDPNSLLVSKSVAERQPHFYRHLIHYDNDMKKGDLFSDHACRTLATASNILDHMSYFNVNPDEYITNKCKDSLID